MRIGILGGTFNPIHNAHLEMARFARAAASLDRVLFMVAANPPHKRVEDDVPAEERFDLVRLAVRDEAGVEACDMELKRSGKSYTCETLRELKRTSPEAELFLIVGSDMLQDMTDWFHPAEIFGLAEVLCVRRRGLEDGDEAAAAELRRRFGARITVLNERAAPISSTEVRERLCDGLDVSGLLPESVEQACYESGVYFPEDVRRMQERCRAALNPKRYTHTAGTMRAAAMLAGAWGVDPKRARVAALLHDCAKCLDPVTQRVLSGDDEDVDAVDHAFAGAVLARMEYGVTDDGILRAIRLHTTGDEGMEPFDAAIYAADLIEPNRTFPGVEEYRKRVSLGPDEFMRYALGNVERFLERSDKALHPATRRAAAYYENKKKTEGNH